MERISWDCRGAVCKQAKQHGEGWCRGLCEKVTLMAVKREAGARRDRGTVTRKEG